MNNELNELLSQPKGWSLKVTPLKVCYVKDYYIPLELHNTYFFPLKDEYYIKTLKENLNITFERVFLDEQRENEGKNLLLTTDSSTVQKWVDPKHPITKNYSQLVMLSNLSNQESTPLPSVVSSNVNMDFTEEIKKLKEEIKSLKEESEIMKKMIQHGRYFQFNHSEKKSLILNTLQKKTILDVNEFKQLIECSSYDTARSAMKNFSERYPDLVTFEKGTPPLPSLLRFVGWSSPEEKAGAISRIMVPGMTMLKSEVMRRFRINGEDEFKLVCQKLPKGVRLLKWRDGWRLEMKY